MNWQVGVCCFKNGLNRSITYSSLLLLFFCLPARADPALSGGSGLNYMRTADILDSGTIEFNMFGVADSYAIPGNSNRGLDLIIEPGLSVGLFDQIEFGVISPYLANFPAQNDTVVTGVRYTKGFVKLRLSGDDSSWMKVAGTVFATSAPGGGNPQLGSGQANSGAELNISFPRDMASFHISAGRENVDTKDYSSPALGYLRETRDSLMLGWEYNPPERVNYSIEAAFSRYGSTDDDLHIIPGARFYPNNFSVFNMAMYFGIPDAVSRPNVRFFVGMSFGINRPKRLTRLDRIIRKINRIERAMAGLPVAPGYTLKNVQDRTSGEVAVKVVNLSGTDGFDDKVAKFLYDRGFTAVQVKNVKPAVRTSSYILYRSGFKEHAGKLEKLLPKPQSLAYREDLLANEDILVILGADML